jgi:hypothetical protein
MVLTGLRHLAAADPAAMAAQAQAECLLALEQGDAVSAAARARILAAFTAGQGYSADAGYSPASWLIHRTKVTKGTARGHLAWAHRAAGHPQVVAALAEGTVLPESMARTICGWTGKLPASCRQTADTILVARCPSSQSGSSVANPHEQVNDHQLSGRRCAAAGRPRRSWRLPIASCGRYRAAWSRVLAVKFQIA